MAEYTKDNLQVTLFSTGNAKVPYSGTMYVTKAGLQSVIEELDKHGVDEANLEFISFINAFTTKRGEQGSVQNIIRANQAKMDEKGIVTL